MTKCRALKAFCAAECGVVALITALCIPLILGCLGLAIDYGRAVSLHRRAQAALDAAVLAGANALVPDNERSAMFEMYFKKNLGTDLDKVSKLKFTHTAAAGGTGEVTIVSAPLFMTILGAGKGSYDLVSRAKHEENVNLEVVLALDVSGSMMATDMGGGTRLNALKTSAKMLIDTIMANKSPSQTFRFGIVPFNMAINIGRENVDLVENTGHALFNGTVWGGCVLERRSGHHSKDTYNAGATDGSGKWPAYIWPPAPNTTSTCLNKSNGTNSGYSSVETAPLGLDPWQDGPNFNCPRFPITRLTTSDVDARAAIDDLVAYGNMGTTIGPAVGWALRMLSPTGPFKDGAAFSKSTRKILIVVTDGEMVTDGASCSGATNSTVAYRFDPASLGLQGRVMNSAPIVDSFTPYGYLADSDPFNKGVNSWTSADLELDRLSIEARTEAKNRYTGKGAIEIFTIAASTGAGPATRAHGVLSACAGKPGNFLYAANAAGLDDAFRAIAKRAMQLQLTQ